MMSCSNNIIIWQKWIDPYGLDENNLEDVTEPKFITDDDEPDYDNETENTDTIQQFNGGIKIIATPMGFIPLTEHTSTSKIFNFWVGHTNFDLTENIVNIIECTPGVETLDVFTRYRFRIGVGKAFSDSDVMREINKLVYGSIEDEL